MNRWLKAVTKQIMPLMLRKRIQLQRLRAKNPDKAKAWEFKREFFYNAFRALDFNGITGDYVEFGSYGGMTFRLAFDQISCRRMQRHMWAFDSFQGLPENTSRKDHHPKWKRGVMATDVERFHEICHSHGIPGTGYTAVEGFYEETLGSKSGSAEPSDIALAYIDCDLYSSTSTVLDFLAPRLKHGMILAFDDYFCWSPDQVSGERKALLDSSSINKNKWVLTKYRDYGWAGASFVVERADLLNI